MNIQPYDPNIEGGQFGIISGEPGDVYHANPAISNSDLSLFLNDPKRFEARRNGLIESKESAALHFGDVFHTRCLESDEVFQGRFVLDSSVPPKPTKAQVEAHLKFTLKYKPTLNLEGDEICFDAECMEVAKKPQVEAYMRQDNIIRQYDQFWKAQGDRKVVSGDDSRRAYMMHESLFSDTDAAQILHGFGAMHKELTLRTGPLEYGFSVQSKLDIYDEKNGIAIDLKTVSNLDKFRRNFVDFGYYRQKAFYINVANLLLDNEIKRFYFIAVESEAPHEVAVFEASPHSIHQGIREIKTGLHALGKALELNQFGKRYPGIQELDLKKWDDSVIESRLERVASGVAA